MTIAVMTRASLGYTGRDLTATLPIRAIYVALGLAALVRLAVPFAPGVATMALLELAGAAWIAGFAGFAVVFGPMLLRPRFAG